MKKIICKKCNKPKVGIDVGFGSDVGAQICWKCDGRSDNWDYYQIYKAIKERIIKDKADLLWYFQKGNINCVETAKLVKFLNYKNEKKK